MCLINLKLKVIETKVNCLNKHKFANYRISSGGPAAARLVRGTRDGAGGSRGAAGVPSGAAATRGTVYRRC